MPQSGAKRRAAGRKGRRRTARWKRAACDACDCMLSDGAAPVRDRDREEAVAWLPLDLVLMGHTAEFVVRHGYALLFVWLLAEQGALPLPSIPLLLACGALSRSGQLNPVLVVLSGMAACLVADNVWFHLGRRRGARILKFLCRNALEPDSCVRKTENAFSKYGVRSLLVAKFVPGLNAVAAPMAGSSGTSLGR